MPAGRRTPWLICYDIADPPRLQRVHRTITRHAVPLQYSVFCTEATRTIVTDILADVSDHIDPRYDDVRAYPLLTTSRPVLYGRSLLPGRVAFLGSAASFFNSAGLSGDRLSARLMKARNSQIP